MAVHIALLGFLLLFALAEYLKYSQYLDNKHLDDFLSTIDLTNLSKVKIIEKINNAVYFNKGFAKNKQYFVFKRLGPTPFQILQAGGDCADKSRLLSALLKRLNIDSTLVMLHGCATCGPTHTIVSAQYEEGSMAADPVFNIVFPKSDDSYYGVPELKVDPDILLKRLDYLENLRGKNDKIAFYNRVTESYKWPKTINWDKNIILKKISSFLKKFDVDPYLLKRPFFLENPKIVIIFTVIIAALINGIGVIGLEA